MSRAQGSGAAALVPLLLAFLKEPARERPRYTSGRESLEGGDHLMRFAQGRFPPQVIARTTPAERIELREAALAFIRQVCLWDNATHYQVLCVRPGARREEIKENYHLLMALIHPDRHDADSVAWPQDGAQRANQAYAVLTDEEKRRDYDATLERLRHVHLPHPASAERAHRSGARGRWGRGVAAIALVLAVVAIALLAMEMPQGDEERESRLLGRWGVARSAGDGAAPRSPRFINSAPGALSADTSLAAKAPMDLPVLAPLLRVLSLPAAPHEDRRVAIAAPASAPIADMAAAHPAAEVLSGAPAAGPISAAVPKPVAAPRTEIVEAAPPAAAPRTEAPPASPRLTSRDIESMVVRLIDSYEAGRVDDLMALVDSSDWGFWSTNLARNSYAQFFHATRERRLRVSSLDWQASGKTARAHGEAQLHAEYTDERGTFEGPVSLELEIALRDGQPRIVRLKLFPNAS